MKNLTITAGGFVDLQYECQQMATDQLLTLVKANGGRIALSSIRDAWDDEASDVSEAVKGNSIALIEIIESNNITMYPIDFCEVVGSVSVVLMDYYGDHHQMYTAQMEDGNVLLIADFLSRTYGQTKSVNELTIKHENIMKVLDVHYGQFSKRFIGFIAKQLPVYKDRILEEDIFSPEHIKECIPKIPEHIERELTQVDTLMRAYECGYFRIIYT